jgi:hypothetical protein
MVNHKRFELTNEIEIQHHYYSNINSDEDSIYYLCHFIGNFPIIYKLFKDEGAAKGLIKTTANVSPRIKIISFFISETLEEHFKIIVDLYDKKDSNCIGFPVVDLYETYWFSVIKHLDNKLKELNGENNKIFPLYVELFAKSGSFEVVKYRFDNYIADYIEFFTKEQKEQIENIIKAINNNNQIYSRGNATNMATLIYNQAQKILSKDFDYKKYPIFYSLVKDLIEKEDTPVLSAPQTEPEDKETEQCP